jgi:hypothetical protein
MILWMNQRTVHYNPTATYPHDMNGPGDDRRKLVLKRVGQVHKVMRLHYEVDGQHAAVYTG